MRSASGRYSRSQHPLADEVLAPDAETLLVGLVEAQKARVRPLVEDRIGDGVDEGLLEGELVGQAQFQPFAFGDVIEDGDELIHSVGEGGYRVVPVQRGEIRLEADRVAPVDDPRVDVQVGRRLGPVQSGGERAHRPVRRDAGIPLELGLTSRMR